MVSLYWLFTVVFLVCCSTTTFARDDLTSRRENNSTNINISYLNATTNTTACNLLMDKSKINEVLSKHDETNTVKMKISVVPGNKTRYFQESEMAWASEVGRTIISLIKRVKGTIFTSPLFTAILEVGTEEVDIQVKEETEGCLPSGERGTGHIFNFLLRQLSHRDDAHVFKLCQAHTDETTGYTAYYCCRIVGDENLVVCADYMSIVVKWALPVVTFTFCISCLMVVPFVLQYIMTYPKTAESYKMSSSPMSLVSIASVILFEGHGVYRSFFRRCVFAGFSYLVVFSPNFFEYEWLKWLFVLWVAVFVFSQKCMPMTHKEYNTSDKRPEQTGTDTNHTSTLQWDVKLISCFTNPARWLLKVTEWCKKTCCSTNGNEECCETFAFVYSPIVCLCGIPFYLIGYCLFAAFCLIKFFLFDLSLFFILPNHCCDGGKKTVQKMFLVLLRLSTLVIIMIFTGMIFISVLYLVASITLNAEYFNPFIAPFLTLMGYFWKNWKSSVEAKYLELKTLIIEIGEKNLPEKRKNLEVNDTTADATNRDKSMDGKRGPIGPTEDTSENTNLYFEIGGKSIIGRTLSYMTKVRQRFRKNFTKQSAKNFFKWIIFCFTFSEEYFLSVCTPLVC